MERSGDTNICLELFSRKLGDTQAFIWTMSKRHKVSRCPVNTKHFITFVQCWTNVGDVGPTLYKCYKSVFVFSGRVLFVAHMTRLLS